MKTSFTFIFVLILCLSTPLYLSAQGNADKDNYWILEDFKQFPIEDDWNVFPVNYKTYPNDINLKAVYASIEEGMDCAYGQNVLRVRGLEENGSVEFTVPNLSKATIHITGKQKASDRGVIIYRDGIEIKRYTDLDRYDCMIFVDDFPSDKPVTYKLTGENPNRRDPFVLYYVEVQKYGVNIPPPVEQKVDSTKYWIYEDFKEFELEEDYNHQKDYLMRPNHIKLATDSASIELGEGCSGGYGNKILRIRGKAFGGGKAEFTVPDAKEVSITITAKSTWEDRTVEIYRNNVLIRKFEKMDRHSCLEFLDDINSQEPITYRIEGYGVNTWDNSITEKPVGIKSIYVTKYDYTDIPSVNNELINIYPNPVYETVYFSVNVLSASIYDMNGRLVATEKNSKQMDVSNLAKGLYIIKVATEGDVQSYKLVKN
jgi:hypothetical protein